MNFSVFLSCARWRTATNPGDTPRLWDLGPALRWVRVGLAAVLLGTRPSLQNLLRLARPSLVRLLHRYYIRGLGRIPTPPSRSCPALAFRLPGPDCSTQPQRRSPVFGDWVLVHMVSPLVEGGGAGLFDYVGPRPASRLAAVQVVPSPSGNRVSIPNKFFGALSPSPSFPLFTLQSLPHDNDRKTRGQNGFAIPFL